MVVKVPCLKANVIKLREANFSMLFSPSFLPAKERVNERSDVRVSKLWKRHQAQMPGAQLTHPDYSASWQMVDPLCDKSQRG